MLEGREREIETTQRCLIVSSGNNVVGKTPPHGHALLLVNQQRVLFNFDVFLKALLVPQEVAQGLVGLLQLVLEDLDAVRDLRHLLEQLVVGPVVAGLNLWSPCPLLQPRLGHSQRGVLRSYVAFQPLNVALLFVDFLEVDMIDIYSSVKWSLNSL